MSRVVITRQRDIRAIHRYIRDRAPQAAVGWSRGIRAQIKTLARHPERCPLAPESATFNERIREMLYGKGSRGTYCILFAILEKSVFVLHVRHGSMDILRPED